MTPAAPRAPRQDFVRLGRNCWIPAIQADDLAARCDAVLATCAAHSVVSSLTAARLHKFWLPRMPGTIHIATATPGRRGRSMTRTKRPEFVAHRFQLSEQDIVSVRGVPVSSPARTWRDLAGLLTLPDLVAAGDGVLRSGTTIDELRSVIDRTQRARHAQAARRAYALLDGRSRSRPETHLRLSVNVAGLPRFAVNEPIYRDEGGWLAEPDLSLAAAKIALEYQGDDHANLDRMRKDITRSRDLRMSGWLVLYFGPAEVFGRAWSIAAEVRAAIADRAPHLLQARRRLQLRSA